MATKQITYRNDKAVVVRVYVEKPRKKRSSSNHIHHHHQHHHHHHLHHYHIHQGVREGVVHGSASKGYDRRAGLLKYSHLLRESARGTISTQVPLIAPSNNKKPDVGKSACFGNWKLLIPSFLRSRSKAPKKEKKKKQMLGGVLEDGMKILQVRRGKSLIPNVFSKSRMGA
ncbi:hypothetical protein RJT34_29745 [Clitoria ternatea]|uniref:Uncharacterized protein n=1 Tax=Clitoria ternatea TaxID=43366 RepID=A0AAN9ES35_CLITE